MVYKKYIKREGKVYGPYSYHSRRVNGKVVSEYHGAEKKISYGKFLWIFLGVFLIIALIYGATSFNSQISGKVTLDIESSYQEGQLLEGNLKLHLSEEEFLPASTKIMVNLDDVTYEYLLSDLISDVPFDGDFYIDSKPISGSGKGYGFNNIVYFTLIISDLVKEENEEESEPEEIPELEEELNETIEEPISNETPEEIVSNETEEIIEEQEKSLEQIEENEEESEPEEVVELEPTPEPEQSPITGEVISDGNEINGQVTKDSQFEYSLEDNQTAQIKSGSVRTNSVNLPDSDINLNIQDNLVVVSTDYSKEDQYELIVDLTKLEIQSEQGLITISLVYEDTELVSASKTITTGEPVIDEIPEEIIIPNETIQENITTITNQTITNTTIVDIANISVNTTIINVTKGYKVILNRPVKWKKNIKAEENKTVRVKIPKQATNISVFKIVGELREELNETSEEKPEDQINKTTLENEVIENITETNDSITLQNTNTAKIDITGEVVVGQISAEIEPVKERFSFIDFFKNLFNTLTGRVITTEETIESKEIIIDDNATEYEIEYVTPGPSSYEEDILKGKSIVISAPDELNYTDILAYTELPQEISFGFTKLYHIVNNSKVLVDITEYDLDNNALVDYIEWIVPHLSNQTYELEITIINVQSYPTVGGNWTVRFNTSGVANLTISAYNSTTWTNYSENSSLYDLKFLEIKCGNETLDYELLGTNCFISGDCSVFVPDYSCNSTGYETSKVLADGIHDLEFDFGGQKAYAHNLAFYTTNDTSANNWSAGTFVDTKTDTQNVTLNGTEDNTNGQNYLASSSHGASSPSNAFDENTADNPSNAWWATTNNNQWLAVDFSNQKVITLIRVYGRNRGRSIGSYTIYGSNSAAGSGGTVLDSGTGVSVEDFQDFSFSNSVAYKYYTFYITNTLLGTDPVGITEMEMMESLYATSGNYTSQIFDAGSSSTWETLDWTNTSSTGNNITFQVMSCDDASCSGETWVGPDNTSSTYFLTQPITLNTSITPNTQYFRYAAFFETNASSLSETSYLQDVNISYTSALTTNATGEYTYTWTSAASPGIYPIKVNSTYGNYYGENTQTLNVSLFAECSPSTNTNWIITDKQICTNKDLNIGTGTLIVDTGGTLYLKQYSNLTVSGLEITRTGDSIFIDKGSELIIV